MPGFWHIVYIAEGVSQQIKKTVEHVSIGCNLIYLNVN